MGLRAWVSRRKAEQYQWEFDRGFGWVMTRYFNYKDPEWWIAEQVYGGCWDDDAYDDGAKAALRLLPMEHF